MAKTAALILMCIVYLFISLKVAQGAGVQDKESSLVVLLGERRFVLRALHHNAHLDLPELRAGGNTNHLEERPW